VFVTHLSIFANHCTDKPFAEKSVFLSILSIIGLIPGQKVPSLCKKTELYAKAKKGKGEINYCFVVGGWLFVLAQNLINL